MNVWKIRIFSGVGQDRNDRPCNKGIVKSEDIRQASAFVHEGVDEGSQSLTVEIEATAENSDITNLDPYSVKWFS